jgi:hypothetical protein
VGVGWTADKEAESASEKSMAEQETMLVEDLGRGGESACCVEVLLV